MSDKWYDKCDKWYVERERESEGRREERERERERAIIKKNGKILKIGESGYRIVVGKIMVPSKISIS